MHPNSATLQQNIDVVCLQIHSRVKKLRAKKVPSEVIVLDAHSSMPVEVSGNVGVYLTKRPDVKRGSWLEVVEQIVGDLWLPIKNMLYLPAQVDRPYTRPRLSCVRHR